MKLPFFTNGKLPAFMTGVAAEFMAKPAAPVAQAPLADPVAELVVAQIRAELPELILVAVVDTASGQELASYTSLPSFNPQTAASLNAAIVKQKSLALQAFHLENELLEDVIISTTSQHHLIKTINNLQKFIYLAVFARTTGAGFAREVLRRHALALVA